VRASKYLGRALWRSLTGYHCRSQPSVGQETGAETAPVMWFVAKGCMSGCQTFRINSRNDLTVRWFRLSHGQLVQAHSATANMRVVRPAKACVIESWPEKSAIVDLTSSHEQADRSLGLSQTACSSVVITRGRARMITMKSECFSTESTQKRLMLHGAQTAVSVRNTDLTKANLQTDHEDQFWQLHDRCGKAQMPPVYRPTASSRQLLEGYVPPHSQATLPRYP